MDQSDQKKNYKRKYIRYVRKDIKVSVTRLNVFGFREKIDCKLVDISSGGAQLYTQKKLNKNIKLTLNLKFKNNKELQLKAQVVVHHQDINHFVSNHSFPTIKKIFKKKTASLRRLHLYESDKQIVSKYRDLTNTSVKTMTQAQLNKKLQHSLLFNMSNGEKIKIDTQIGDCQHSRYYSYGVKFNNPNDDLTESMLETQTDWIFNS